MAKQNEILIDASECLRSVHIKFRLPRLLGFRFWLAAKLFALGGMISGTTVEIEVSGEG